MPHNIFSHKNPVNLHITIGFEFIQYIARHPVKDSQCHVVVHQDYTRHSNGFQSSVEKQKANIDLINIVLFTINDFLQQQWQLLSQWHISTSPGHSPLLQCSDTLFRNFYSQLRWQKGWWILWLLWVTSIMSFMIQPMFPELALVQYNVVVKTYILNRTLPKGLKINSGVCTEHCYCIIDLFSSKLKWLIAW